MAEAIMRTRIAISTTILGGFGLVPLDMQDVHAQDEPSVYIVTEIVVTNTEAYMKEYLPLARTTIETYGGKLLTKSLKLTSLEGECPKYAAIYHWNSMDEVHAYYNSDEFKKVREIGSKCAKFRAYAIEALPR